MPRLLGPGVSELILGKTGSTDTSVSAGEDDDKSVCQVKGHPADVTLDRCPPGDEWTQHNTRKSPHAEEYVEDHICTHTHVHTMYLCIMGSF